MGVSTSAISDGLLVGAMASVVIAAPNTSRDALIVFNKQYVLYVKCGLGAGPTDFTYMLTSNSTLEIPNYQGVVTAICSQNYTYVRVTELN